MARFDSQAKNTRSSAFQTSISRGPISTEKRSEWSLSPSIKAERNLRDLPCRPAKSLNYCQGRKSYILECFRKTEKSNNNVMKPILDEMSVPVNRFPIFTRTNIVKSTETEKPEDMKCEFLKSLKSTSMKVRSKRYSFLCNNPGSDDTCRSLLLQMDNWSDSRKQGTSRICFCSSSRSVQITPGPCFLHSTIETIKTRADQENFTKIRRRLFDSDCSRKNYSGEF